ncbi:MAG: hypothetical protein B7X04_00740 [Parcubacteria group bacterium 21-54-25]|nr:MAG: hypothetical protein B7X04_00740 [Parcubacteria group bacterium 21-54-25]HQU07963.1 biosynthetic peptidoglycan transglycosylase [Candidatus Paceibacterota bacterium]
MKTARILFVFAWILMLAALLFTPLMTIFGDLLAQGQANRTVEQYSANLLATFAAHHRQYVAAAQIPVCAKEGIVSVEDKRFYQDAGIDPIAVVRVLLMSTVNDHVDHGGSTLTQQLARIIIREPRAAPNMLVAAASLLHIFRYALIVNHDFSKQKILELYLNSVYFGKHATGIAQAAQAYFHTSLDTLTLGQCLYLTGLPQAPSIFGQNPQGVIATDRYRHVLTTMVRNHYLTETQAAALAQENLFAKNASQHVLH